MDLRRTVNSGIWLLKPCLSLFPPPTSMWLPCLTPPSFFSSPFTPFQGPCVRCHRTVRVFRSAHCALSTSVGRASSRWDTTWSMLERQDIGPHPDLQNSKFLGYALTGAALEIFHNTCLSTSQTLISMSLS